jgi:L-iditol 2-dehydrogenase
VIVGVYGQDVSINMANVQDREYELIGTLMYVHDDYLEALRLAAEKKVDLSAVITNEFPLLDTAKAYDYIEAHRDDVQKVILNV